MSDLTGPLAMLAVALLIMLGLIGLGLYDVRETNQTIRVCLQEGNPVSECEDLDD